MNDVADNDAREAPLTLGETLARGREEQGLTRNDVAQRLHMSPNQVEALESGDYARLPKGTFLRGFVRNYAKLVALDPHAVLPLLADAAPRETAPGIVVPTQNIRFDPLGERLASPWMKGLVAAFLLICAAFAAMYWWVYVRGQSPSRVQAQQETPPAPATVASPPTQIAQPPVEPMPQPASSPPVASSTTDAAPANVSPAPASAGTAPTSTAPASEPAKSSEAPKAVAAATPVPKGARRLHFRFKGESWVEVRDAAGRIVFQQLNPAGGEADVNGKPPLQVVVGNAPEVEMDRDGQPFDLAPSTHVAVARFTVE